MSDFLLTKSNLGKTKLRFKLAAFVTAIAVVLVFIAVRFQTKEFLVSAPAERRTDRTYSRMWFDNRETLVGAIEQPGKLTIERWAGGGASAKTWEFDLPQTTQWTTAADLSRLAWISGSTLYCRTLADGAKTTPISIALPARKKVLTIDMLSDGSVAVVFADSSLDRWDGTTGRALSTRQLELTEADQAVAADDYVAISSSHAGRLLMYRFRTENGWTLVEESPAPDPPYR